MQTEASIYNSEVTARERLGEELTDVQEAIAAHERQQEMLQLVFARDEPEEVKAPQLSPEDAADRQQAEERRHDKIRALLGDRADTTLTDEQVSDRDRTKSIRQ